MHKAAVALLAVPVLAVVYLGALLRRSTLARASLAIGLAIVLGAGVVGATRPTVTVATPPTVILPLTQGEFQTTVTTDRAVAEPVTISFSAPMDARSVASAVIVDPPTAVDLTWDATGTKLTITPVRTWTPGVLHTVTVQPGALDRTGQPLARPARAVFLTRPATTGSAAATDVLGTRVSIGTTFSLTFGGPVDPATIRDAVRLEPPVAGTVVATDRMDGLARYEFVPTSPLAPDTRYRLIVAGVHDSRWPGPRAVLDRGPHLEGAVGHPLPATHGHARRRARRGHLGPVQPVHGPRHDRQGVRGQRGRQGHRRHDQLGRVGHGPGLQAQGRPALRDRLRRHGRPDRIEQGRRTPR